MQCIFPELPSVSIIYKFIRISVVSRLSMTVGAMIVSVITVPITSAGVLTGITLCTQHVCEPSLAPESTVASAHIFAVVANGMQEGSEQLARSSGARGKVSCRPLQGLELMRLFCLATTVHMARFVSS